MAGIQVAVTVFLKGQVNGGIGNAIVVYKEHPRKVSRYFSAASSFIREKIVPTSFSVAGLIMKFDAVVNAPSWFRGLEITFNRRLYLPLYKCPTCRW